MAFQTAKVTLTLHKDNVMVLYGITPPELMILRELHYKESAGTPIGDNLQLLPDPAVEIDQPGKAAEPEYFHTGTGKTVPDKDAIPPVTHVRTNREEVDRLKRKYIAPIPHTPGNTPVFVEIFGASPAVKLPETFDEVLPGLGLNPILPVDAVIEVNPEVNDLAGKLRSELVTEAVKLGLTVKQTDSKEQLIGAIIVAKSKIGTESKAA